jgi:hypothetical protein
MNCLHAALAHQPAEKVARQLILMIISLAFGGCSFLFSKGPPADYREQGYFDCSGNAAPVLDTVWAGLNGLGSVIAASSSDESWKQQGQTSDRTTSFFVGVMWVAVSGASAIYGYHNAAACSDAKEEVMSESVRYRPSRRTRYVPPKTPAPPPRFLPAETESPPIETAPAQPYVPETPPPPSTGPFQE